jgi:hypothetical protein
MTYRELAQQILELNGEWLDADVSIYIGSMDEFFEARPTILRTPENDVLDKDHPYLEVLEEAT